MITSADTATQAYLRRLRWSALLFLLTLGGGLVASSSAAAAARGALDFGRAAEYDIGAAVEMGLWIMVILPTVLLGVVGLLCYAVCALGLSKRAPWGYRFGTFCAGAGIMVMTLWAAAVPWAFIGGILTDINLSANEEWRPSGLVFVIIVTAAALLGQIAVSINWVRQRRKESRVLKEPAPAGESSDGFRSR